ncbi:hypothetical protein ABG768_023339, partial [Culter alburnus]
MGYGDRNPGLLAPVCTTAPSLRRGASNLGQSGRRACPPNRSHDVAKKGSCGNSFPDRER